MTSEKMTVHRALAELKVIDDRIAKMINATTYVTAVKHSAEKIKGVSVKDFAEKIKSDYQSVNDLMNRRNAMKRAVVLSNATTMVTIGGIEYSVAEAIELKNHGMEHKASLLRMMTYGYDVAQNELSRNDAEAIEKKAEQYILNVIQAQPKDSKMSIDSEAMKALREDYIKNNRYDLIDPLGVTKIMEQLTNELHEFNTEIDAALSVSNAVTVIEFEY